MRVWILGALLLVAANNTSDSYRQTTKKILADDACERARKDSERTQEICSRDAARCAAPCDACKDRCDTVRVLDLDACEVDVLPPQCKQMAKEAHGECCKACDKSSKCSRDTEACAQATESCKTASDASRAATEACRSPK